MDVIWGGYSIVTGTERKGIKPVKKRFYIGLLLVLGIFGLLSGCGRDSSDQTEGNSRSEEGSKSRTEEEPEGGATPHKVMRGPMHKGGPRIHTLTH